MFIKRQYLVKNVAYVAQARAEYLFPSCLSIKRTCNFQFRERRSSPEKSYTSQCETGLWTSCHSWWQAPSPDCSAAGYVGFPPPAGTTRREHQRQPSRTLWREEETAKYKAWEKRRRDEKKSEWKRGEDGASFYMFMLRLVIVKVFLLHWVFS